MQYDLPFKNFSAGSVYCDDVACLDERSCLFRSNNRWNTKLPRNNSRMRSSTAFFCDNRSSLLHRGYIVWISLGRNKDIAVPNFVDFFGRKDNFCGADSCAGRCRSTNNQRNLKFWISYFRLNILIFAFCILIFYSCDGSGLDYKYVFSFDRPLDILGKKIMMFN